MALLPRLLAATPSPLDDYWYRPVSEVSTAGLPVHPSTALSIGAVFACARVLAESVAQLPLLLYRRTEDGGKERATDHYLYPVLHDQPNKRQTSFQFREMMMGHLALRGNAYAQIVPGPRGFAQELIPLHPDRMEVDQMPSGAVRYRYRRADGTAQIFSEERIFHLSTLSDNGVTGLSLITLARDSLGLAKATEEYGARFFGQGARPRGTLTHPGRLSEAAKKNLRESLQTEFSGLKQSHGTMLLEEGLTWTQIGLSNEDSQFLGSREFSVTEIARWFRVPPHMIGDLTRSTFSNIENESLNFARFTMQPWYVRWEQAIKKDLILDEDDIFAEFLMDGFLRGDTLSRAQANQIYINTGVLTRNEVRAMENRNPLPGLDEPLTPANITGKPAPQQMPANGQTRALALEAAARVVRKEQKAIGAAAVRLAADPQAFAGWVTDFYAEHGQWIAKTTPLSHVDAIQYCNEQRDAIKRQGIGALEDWMPSRAVHLAEIILGGE